MSKNDIRYETFEHTADIGLRAFGNDAAALFANAALGMFAIIAGSAGKPVPLRRQTGTPFAVAVSAANTEELLVAMAKRTARPGRYP